MLDMVLNIPLSYLGPCLHVFRTPKIVYGFKELTIFAKELRYKCLIGPNLCPKLNVRNMTTYSEPNRTPNMELFTKLVNGFQLFNC